MTEGAHAPPSLTVLLLSLLVPALALAVPTQLNHQGRLLDSAGLPIQGELPITFTLEDAEESGNVLWSETLDVDFSDGYYSVKLGSSDDNVIDAALLAEASLWIGLTIDGGDQLSPRLSKFVYGQTRGQPRYHRA